MLLNHFDANEEGNVATFADIRFYSYISLVEVWRNLQACILDFCFNFTYFLILLIASLLDLIQYLVKKTPGGR